MSTTLFRRQAREKPPEMPGGELSLQEPPVLPETVGGGMGGTLMYLPMAIGGGAAMLFFMGPQNPQMAFMMAGMMGLMGVMMVVSQLGRGGADRRQRLRGERRDYLRYLAGTRVQVRAVADRQRTALRWRHPEPAALWSVAMTGRLWERRAAHADFAEVRIGVGPQRLAMTMTPLNTKPVADLEPLSARALRRFTNAYTTIADQPTALFLRGFAQVRYRGDDDTIRASVRALIAQLVTFHSPEDLRIAVCATPDRLPDWDWVKWLPHAQHPVEQDGAGQVRLLTDGVDALTELLAAELADRARFEAAATPSREEPYVVVVLDGTTVPAESRLAAAGYRNTVVLDVSGALDGAAGRSRLRLEVTSTELHTVRTDRTGQEVRTHLGRPDTLSVARAGSLARVVSPYRINSTGDVAEPMVADFDLPRLLGVSDLDLYTPKSLWRTGMGSDRFRIPLGIAEDGSSVDLDIKESAQGGMGPHGLLIGATGSGKSELLRTLVLGLAMTHSSEILNFVLVDFKGGATFLGLDRLPHTSAVITNLADEAPLVTRMQDSLHGEMVRRQELLRAAGNYSSLLDYERARQAGAALDPLPTLFLIVDEFSELLAANPDFAELFVMIGRLGRSLGVHLLLASQRIDDGRMHKLESHLSYRIGLRTFSAMESRSVIGVPDAYQLPSAPGNGYLRSDVATLVRFKAAYVSCRYQRRTREQRQEEVRRQVVAFGAGRLPAEAASVAEVGAPVAEEHVDTVLDVAVDKLLGQGPPAHQVWLPPLDTPPPLDQLLPPLVPHPELGLTPADWPGRGCLTVPVGVVDKPFEQVRDLHMVDLSGSGGHVGIAGGTQSGKSTLLRTVITGLALTHTPAEVQFYCLDFGGGTLSVLEGLPHVGGVCGRLQPERVGRTIAEVKAVLAEREKVFAEHGVESMAAYRARRAAGEFPDDPHGDVFLVVDGWGSLRADFEQHDQAIRQLTVRGLAYGVHLLLTTGRWSDVHSALRDQLGTRLELRLGDAIDSVIDMRKAGQVPRLPGRGLTADKLHFLAAIPRADGRSALDDLAEATRELARAVGESWTGPVAPPVRTLPSTLPVAELPAPEGRMRIALGAGELDLKPVWHDFATRPHLTVVGDAASGKTAVLRLITTAIPKVYGPDEAKVLLVDPRRSLLESVPEAYRHGVAVSSGPAAELVRPLAAELKARVPGPDIAPSRLRDRDWWTGPEYFVVVDDYDLVHNGAGGPLDSLVELLPQAADIGLHVLLSRAAAGSGRMSMDSVVRRLQESNTPDLALSMPPNEMPLLNGQRGRQLPPGRAMLVTRRDSSLLQIAWTEEA
ncbi:type VII secretion protein EccCa [Actinokineospora auranticolor]|uniref:S-DNA-T family DNA segregation ATPase FtsK/SpoIIIE n=1 Tax=Actinokineospora auranticolor TaxID=155976 RepID=A0A2S6H0B9_9PSEU|nr:type VII secretion protein EccCa [Actinokineospora auranticolor]PPK70908.1 S-DNA-T family DNA segregation ATPase FtsK/SpoIIIE [Actinokineospora auranticolor]